VFSCFLDTSAYAKLYHHEDGSQFVEKLLNQPAWTVIVSRLSLVEIESVIAIKARTGELDVSGQELCRKRIRADISQGRVEVGPAIHQLHYSTARRLLHEYGVSMGLRTLDALQLAIALDLQERGRLSAMVAADKRLCRVAESCGCPAVDPRGPSTNLLLR
jgi:predicted nucleic acid-binding protein